MNKWLLLVLTFTLSLTGCSESQFSNVTGLSSSAYTKDTNALTEDASEEVQDNVSCQKEEPDFEAIKDSLTSKLTSLIAKLEATDISNYTENQIARHDQFLAKVKADLEVVSNATELSDALKTVARRVWRKPHGRRPPVGDDFACRREVRAEIKDRHCADLQRLLDRDDLSESLRQALLERFQSSCEASD